MYINVSFQTKNGKFEAANEVDKILGHSAMHLVTKNWSCSMVEHMFKLGHTHVEGLSELTLQRVSSHFEKQSFQDPLRLSDSLL